jgi:hypothetical protein
MGPEQPLSRTAVDKLLFRFFHDHLLVLQHEKYQLGARTINSAVLHSRRHVAKTNSYTVVPRYGRCYMLGNKF